MAAINSEQAEVKKEQDLFSEADHILNIEFEQNIDIAETYVPKSHIMTLEEAISMVTKERKKIKYTR